MRKIVVGIALLLCAMAGFAADATTPEINAPSNGQDWTKLSSTEKLFWSIGYSQVYADALSKIDVASGPNSPCANLAARTDRQTSTAGQVTAFAPAAGRAKFYADPAITL